VTLVDTSVWIDFFTGHHAAHVAALEHLILDDEELALCGIALTEILQGIDDEPEYRRVRRRLRPLVLLPIEENTLVDAANLYRRLRSKGVTLRKTNDCIVAATAIRHRCTPLHDDRAFDAVAAHCPLAVAPPP